MGMVGNLQIKSLSGRHCYQCSRLSRNLTSLAQGEVGACSRHLGRK